MIWQIACTIPDKALTITTAIVSQSRSGLVFALVCFVFRLLTVQNVVQSGAPNKCDAAHHE